MALRLLKANVQIEALRKKLNSTKMPSLERVARSKANRIFKSQLEKMLKAFDKNPVTKEIEAGAFTKNTSGTLGGYGNLFSFIGFFEGDTPTKDLRELLVAASQLNAPKYYRGQWSFVVSIPKKAQIESVSRMPWSSESWALGIEKGISGLGNYLRVNKSNSRSRGGEQIETKISSGSFSTRAYLSEILENFKAGIESGRV